VCIELFPLPFFNETTSLAYAVPLDRVTFTEKETKAIAVKEKRKKEIVHKTEFHRNLIVR
jgi:hypothetical protein